MRDVADALPLGRSTEDPLNSPLPGGDAERSDDDRGESTPKRPTGLRIDGDAVTLSIAGHGVIDLLVVFRDGS